MGFIMSKIIIDFTNVYKMRTNSKYTMMSKLFPIDKRVDVGRRYGMQESFFL